MLIRYIIFTLLFFGCMLGAAYVLDYVLTKLDKYNSLEDICDEYNLTGVNCTGGESDCGYLVKCVAWHSKNACDDFPC